MVMNSGLISSPMTEAFPAGLRVLVVDDDPTWLKILEKMLKKCSYDVTTCGLAREALRLLRDRKDGFDIVISDVNMPDMDGFKLLEHVGLEMDLPVIMMSVDGETSRVMKGVQHGACDYLLKPIRMKELKNIWQHVLRKRMHEVRDIECFEDRNGPDNFDGIYGGDQTSLKKRKDVENKHDEKGLSDPSTKKARVIWTVELQQKFLNAVNQMGIDSDKVGPKKILDLMKVPGLTRENVASHLQKYRLYLNRIRKEDKMESSFGGTKNSDFSPKEPSGICGLQNPPFGLQNDVSGNCGFLGSQLPVQADAKPLETDVKSSDMYPLAEQRKPSNSENSDPHKVTSSQAGLSHTLGSLETSINCSSFDSRVAGRYPWAAEIPEMQFETELKEHPNFVQADLLEPAPHINPGPSISEGRNLGGLIDIKPLNVKSQRRNDISQLSPTPIEQELESFPVCPQAFGCVFDMPLGVENHYSREGPPDGIKEQVSSERLIQSLPLHSKSHTSNLLASESNFNVTLDMKGQNSSEDNIIGLESEFRNPVLKSEPYLELLDEELLFRWLQGCDGPSKDVGFDYLGYPDFNFPDHIGEVSLQPYAPKSVIDYEYPLDSFEHPFLDQGLLFSRI